MAHDADIAGQRVCAALSLIGTGDRLGRGVPAGHVQIVKGAIRCGLIRRFRYLYGRNSLSVERNMTRVLTIEDDEITAIDIAEELRARGFSVDWVDNAREGVTRAISDEYDVITLDRMLPGGDGLTIVTTMRSLGVYTPVLMLSALGDVDERIRGLRAGGDDYLTKPFNLVEMAARLEMLLRRRRRAPTVQKETTLRVGNLELDLIARKLSCGNEEIALLPTEYRVLEFMMRHAGKTITRTMLFEAVWGYHLDPGSKLIDVHVGRLRKKIEPLDGTPLIRTVRSIGHVLIEN
jgi:two-component system OmpR family response regulator